FGLLAHLSRQVRAARIGLVDQHAERSLQSVSKIADLRARALYDLPVSVDELVHLCRQRRHILWELASDVFGLAAADRGDSLAQRAKRAQAVADGKRGRADQRQ